MESWLLVENATVIDGTGAAAITGCSVLIEGDRIRAVGPDVDETVVARGVRLDRIDAIGKTVIPGLIDAHCHTSFGEARTQEEQDLYTSVELRTLRSAWNLKKMLRAGVTGISDPGGSFYIAVGLREAIREGLVEGPRMAASGRFLTTSNGLSDFYPTAVGVPESSIGMLTNTPDEMRRAVRAQVKNGVDLIKLADSPYGDYEAFRPDEVKMISEIAHGLNRKVTMHARGSANVDTAIAAEIDWIMHGNQMTDEVIERLAASKIPLCPTLALIANMADWGSLVGVPVAKRDIYKRIMDRTAVTLHKAHEAGVILITGTDSGFAVTPYGEWHARELELLITFAGLTPLEAIRAATSDAAVTVGLPGELGIIASGALADMVIVDGDPLADIRILQDRSRIQTVIKGGVVVKFDDTHEDERHPYNRAMTIATGDLTYALVHGGAESAAIESIPMTLDEGKTLASGISAAKATARID